MVSRVLFFDTETTGVALWDQPPQHPDQPHIVQLAALLTDAEGNELETLNVICALPAGVEVPPGAEKVHGISTERANKDGIPLPHALWMFDRMLGKADVLVAHNIDFDLMLVRAAHAKIGFMHRLHDVRKFCTMKSNTELCKIPSPRGRGYKWPSLTEAHKHYLGCEFDGAHDALADVSACARVFFAMPGYVTGIQAAA